MRDSIENLLLEEQFSVGKNGLRYRWRCCSRYVHNLDVIDRSQGSTKVKNSGRERVGRKPLEEDQDGHAGRYQPRLNGMERVRDFELGDFQMRNMVCQH